MAGPGGDYRAVRPRSRVEDAEGLIMVVAPVVYIALGFFAGVRSDAALSHRRGMALVGDLPRGRR